MSQTFNPQQHISFVNQYWKHNSEMSIGLFIVVNTDNQKQIKKTIQSLKKLRYNNKKVYLIDSSEGALYKPVASDLGVKYVYAKSSKYTDSTIDTIISGLAGIAASISLNSGVALQKNTLRELVPYLHTGTHVVLSPLTVKGRNKWSPSLVMALSPMSATQSNYIPLPFAEITKEELSLVPADQLVFTKRSLARRLYAFVATPIFVPVEYLITGGAVVIIIAASGAVMVRSYASKKLTSVANTSSTAQVLGQSTAASSSTKLHAKAQPTTTNPNVPLTDPTAPTDLVFTIQSGDTMSGLISQYINQMHAKYPQISTPRLGYAQDYLMRNYGYNMLQLSQKTFTVSSADVVSAWSDASGADDNAAFWNAYAIRVGIVS